jgi:hypothetical protein
MSNSEPIYWQHSVFFRQSNNALKPTPNRGPRIDRKDLRYMQHISKNGIWLGGPREHLARLSARRSARLRRAESRH